MPKILVADDNTNIQKMVVLAFEDRGITVVSVGNGEAAVRRIPDMNPDLVLADIFMPVRNGYEVCEFVKKDSRFSHIPVILLVGAFDPLDEKEARRVGADGVLKKPFVPPDPLIAMVISALEKNPKLVAEMAKARETPAPAATPEPLPAALEAPARAEVKPLPVYPDPTPEEAALVYGFGSGKRGNEAAPEEIAPLTLETDVATDDSESGHDWRRNAMEFEIPEETSKRTAFALDDDAAMAMFPSEKDVPPKHMPPIQMDEPKPASEAATIIRPSVLAPTPAAPQAPAAPVAQAPAAPVAQAPAAVQTPEPEPAKPVATAQAPVAEVPTPAPISSATQYRQPWLAESEEEEPVAASPSDQRWAPPVASRKGELPPPVWLSETEIEPETDTETEPETVPEIDATAQEAPLETAFGVKAHASVAAITEAREAAPVLPVQTSEFEFKSAPVAELAIETAPEPEPIAEATVPPTLEMQPVTEPAFGSQNTHWLDAMHEPQQPEESKEVSYNSPAQDPALELAPVVKTAPDALLEMPERPVLGPIKSDSLLVHEDPNPTGSYGVRPEPMAPSYTFGDGKPSVSPKPEAPEDQPAQATETPGVVQDFTPEVAQESASEVARGIAPEPAQEPSQEVADERYPAAEPATREILATIPFLTPPPDFLAMARKEAEAAEAGTTSAPEAAHSNGNGDAHRDEQPPVAAVSDANVDAVVRAVLEKLQPQLQDLLSQGVLKPLVENILQKDLAKKEH